MLVDIPIHDASLNGWDGLSFMQQPLKVLEREMRSSPSPLNWHLCCLTWIYEAWSCSVCIQKRRLLSMLVIPELFFSAQGAMDFSLGLAFFNDLSLISCPSSSDNSNFHLNFVAFSIHRNRRNCQSLFLCLPNKLP